MPHAISRMKVYFGLALAMGVGVTLFPAASPTSVGMLHCEGKVYLGGETAGPSTVVFAGDHLRTAEGRATVNLPGNGLIVLGGYSEAALRNYQEGVAVGLEKGQLALAASSQSRVRVETDGLTIRPTDSSASLAEFTILGDGSLDVAVHRGTIVVANLRPEPVVVRAGQILSIGPRVQQSNQSSEGTNQTPGTGAHGKPTFGEKLRRMRIGGLSHNASVALIAAAVAAPTAVGIALATRTTSPSAP